MLNFQHTWAISNLSQLSSVFKPARGTKEATLHSFLNKELRKIHQENAMGNKRLKCKRRTSDPQTVCACTKDILPCREPLRQGTAEVPFGVRFFPRAAWWISQWLFLTSRTGGQSASLDQSSLIACHKCWAHWPKAPWPPMKNPCGEIQYVNRKHTPAIQLNTSMYREITGTSQCLGKKEGFSGANLFAANGTAFSCSPNSLCWFNLSRGLKEAMKFPDKRRTGQDSQLM